MDAKNNSKGAIDDIDYLVADMTDMSFGDCYLAEVPFDLTVNERTLEYRIAGFSPLTLRWDPSALNRFELSNLSVKDPTIAFVELKHFQNRHNFEKELANLVRQAPNLNPATRNSLAVLVPFIGGYRRGVLMRSQNGAETVKVFFVDYGTFHDAKLETLFDLSNHTLAELKPQMMPIYLPGQGLHKPAGFDEDLKSVDYAYLELNQLTNYASMLIEANVKLYKNGHEVNLLDVMVER